jgi:hypothetical protein
MIYEEPPAYLRAGVDFDSGKKPVPVRKKPAK